ATVSSGWYSSGLVWGTPEKRFVYGRDKMLLMQIEVEYRDGTKETLVTDGSWEMAGNQVRISTIYDGETVDHNYVATWTPAKVHEVGYDNLVSTVGKLVTKKKVFKPVKVITTPKGEKVLDFGQNLVGWEKAVLRGHKGDTVVISHAEVLDGEGNFYTTNLRSAKALSTYVLSGEGSEVFEPRFTFYGFRYIRVEGLEGELNPEDFEAMAISTADITGKFHCSDPMINQLQSNIEWSFRDNFVDIPTDCPQRDERLGWTGDAQVFFTTAAFLDRGVGPFFQKWLADLAADQRADGKVPRTIPDAFPDTDDMGWATGWADAATIIPWNHYLRYGDRTLLEKQYASMALWLNYMVGRSKDNGWIWNNEKLHFADWLAFHKTDMHYVAQCFFANTADILVKTARELGKTEDEKYFKEVYDNVVEAFRNKYINAEGRLTEDTQTAYVLALKFDLFRDRKQSVKACYHLTKLIKANDYHISTGFLGTPYICEVLTKYGYTPLAYTLLLQKTCPSWLYPITKGATTIWERWDSMQEDGTIIKGMNSFNHYSYGAIGTWLYEWALGIKPTSAGYKTFDIQPHIGGGMTEMEGSTETPYGKIYVKWTAKDDKLLTLYVDVPENTTARIVLSPRQVLEVGSGPYSFKTE
nr:glycoside hydrolase family 78 protein [Bacteroidales bacterium]